MPSPFHLLRHHTWATAKPARTASPLPRPGWRRVLMRRWGYAFATRSISSHVLSLAQLVSHAGVPCDPRAGVRHFAQGWCYAPYPTLKPCRCTACTTIAGSSPPLRQSFRLLRPSQPIHSHAQPSHHNRAPRPARRPEFSAAGQVRPRRRHPSHCRVRRCHGACISAFDTGRCGAVDGRRPGTAAAWCRGVVPLPQLSVLARRRRGQHERRRCAADWRALLRRLDLVCCRTIHHV